jgi:hypothetical protein
VTDVGLRAIRSIPQWGLKDWLYLLVGLSVLGGAVWLMGMGFDLVDIDDWFPMVPGAGIGLLVALFFSRRRRALMPEVGQRPLLMWAIIGAFAIVATMAGAGAFRAVNALLDSSDPTEVRLAVLSKAHGRGDYLARVTPADSFSLDPWNFRWLWVTEGDYEELVPGSTIVATVGSGFFSRPWRKSYRVVREPDAKH